MAIDYELDRHPDAAPAPRDRSTAADIARAAEAVRLADSIEDAETPAGRTSVAEASRDGFATGFVDELSSASPTGAFLQTLEAAEQGLSEQDHEARMQRFPELRDVEVARGAAVRYPELVEQPEKRSPQDPEIEDERFGR